MKNKKNIFIILSIVLIVTIILPVSAWSYSNKAKTWMDNGRDNLNTHKYREALYCFYMASFYENDENIKEEIKEYIEKSSNLLRSKGPSSYLVPREPFNFNYILFRRNVISSVPVPPVGHKTIRLKDGSTINLGSYLNKLKKPKSSRKNYWGNGKTVLSSGTDKNKMIALTFDDGPHGKYTPQLLNILKKHDVKATFFVLGKNANHYKKIMKRMKKEGHLVGNHSWSHKNLARAGNSTIDSEIEKTDKIIEALGIDNPVFFRPPYGAMSKRLVSKIEDYKKYIVLWTVDTLDWQHPSASTILRRVFNVVRPGDVILMHDIHPQVIYTMDSLIKVMKNAGYEFVTLDEIYKLKKVDGKRLLSFRDPKNPVKSVLKLSGKSSNKMSEYEKNAILKDKK